MAANRKRLAIVRSRDMQQLEQLDQEAGLHAQLVDSHTQQIRALIERRNAILARSQYMEIRTTGTKTAGVARWRNS